MYYTHPSHQTSIVGKNCAYYIRIFYGIVVKATAVSRNCIESSICQLTVIVIRWLLAMQSAVLAMRIPSVCHTLVPYPDE